MVKSDGLDVFSGNRTERTFKAVCIIGYRENAVIDWIFQINLSKVCIAKVDQVTASTAIDIAYSTIRIEIVIITLDGRKICIAAIQFTTNDRPSYTVSIIRISEVVVCVIKNKSRDITNSIRACIVCALDKVLNNDITCIIFGNGIFIDTRRIVYFTVLGRGDHICVVATICGECKSIDIRCIYSTRIGVWCQIYTRGRCGNLIVKRRTDKPHGWIITVTFYSHARLKCHEGLIRTIDVTIAANAFKPIGVGFTKHDALNVDENVNTLATKRIA